MKKNREEISTPIRYVNHLFKNERQYKTITQKIVSWTF